MGTLIDRIVGGGCDPQAVLLYGPDRQGLESSAYRLASHWSGISPDRIGRCVDFQRISPDGKGMQIRLRAIEETKRTEPDKEPPKWIPAKVFFRTSPLTAKCKVIWFDQADRLNGDAANAFLKTLEELPNHARVVLTTTDISKVIPTVRSRCLCVPCGADSWPDGPPEGAMESAWARNAGELAAIRETAELHTRYWETLAKLPLAPVGAAIWFSEQALDAAAKHAATTGGGVRESQVHFLDLAARWWLAHYAERPEVPIRCAAVAGEILGYASGQIGYDTVFAAMLIQLREPEQGLRK